MPLARSATHPIAHLHRHAVTLGGVLLLSGLLAGAGLAIVQAMLRHHISSTLPLIAVLLSVVLSRTLLYPLARWWVFELRLFPDRVEMRSLVGLRIEHTVYNLAGSTVRLSRGLLDAFLGTGTLTLSTPGGTLRLTLLTPTDALEHWLIYYHSRRG